MKRNFTLGLAVFVLMALMTAVVNAQDADNPWHLIAFENDVEVAFYNTEMITGMETTAQNVTIVLDNGKTFSHPVATTTFGFDPRKEGTATANETVIVPSLNVFYANGRLHFSEPVSGISVYTMYGALVARFEGNVTEIPVNLFQGFYIVQADGKSAKLLVNNSGNGSAPAQPLLASQPVANTYNPVNLRAGNIKIYWNITASSSTLSVEIPNVEKFHFTADNSIIFTLKNGNTIELTDYQGVEFTVEPAPTTTTSNWDLERTIAIGGCTYTMRSAVGGLRTIVFAAVYKDGIAFQSMLMDGTDSRYQWFPNSGINSAMWDKANENSGSRLSVFVGPIWEYGITYPTIFASVPHIGLTRITTGTSIYSVVESWAYNGNTNLIPTIMVQNANGSITMSCKDINGVVHTHTFVNP